MTSPMIAPIIVFLADSTLDLSPPESIHWTPPQIKKRTAMMIAMMIRKVTTLLTIGPNWLPWRLQMLPNPLGQGSTGMFPWANAGRAKASVASDPLRRLVIFFICLIYVRIFFGGLSIVKIVNLRD